MRTLGIFFVRAKVPSNGTKGIHGFGHVNQKEKKDVSEREGALFQKEGKSYPDEMPASTYKW